MHTHSLLCMQRFLLCCTTLTLFFLSSLIHPTFLCCTLSFPTFTILTIAIHSYLYLLTLTSTHYTTEFNCAIHSRLQCHVQLYFLLPYSVRLVWNRLQLCTTVVKCCNVLVVPTPFLRTSNSYRRNGEKHVQYYE